MMANCDVTSLMEGSTKLAVILTVKDGLPVTVTIPSVAKNRIAVFKFIGLSAVILTVPAVADTVRSMVSSMVLSATMETVAVDTIPKSPINVPLRKLLYELSVYKVVPL